MQLVDFEGNETWRCSFYPFYAPNKALDIIEDLTVVPDLQESLCKCLRSQ